MKRADDIKNLFQSFGANTDSYLEIDNRFEYKEPLSTQTRPAIALATTDVAAQSPSLEPVASLAEPIASAEKPPAITVTERLSPSLRQLLAEVAQERLAEAQARNTEALSQALIKGEPEPIRAQVIAVVSTKGGVGKNTLSAALSSTLRLPPGQTLTIDLAPQNALQYHLNVSPDVAGMGNASLQGLNWRALLQPGSAGSQLLPYGDLSEEERNSLEGYLRGDPHWLARQLARMALSEHDVVLLNTPSGRNVYTEQALAVADHVLVVITADAASYVTLDQMDRLLAASLARPHPPQCHYVVNQYDDSRAFNRDMLEVLRRRLGERLLGVVQHDYAISEALAFGCNPLEQPGVVPARQDLLGLCQSLTGQLMTRNIDESTPQ
jgi:cellulose synthase operon protein YhjQ